MVAATLAALLASTALGAPLKLSNSPEKQLAASTGPHFKISFSMRNKTLRRSGNFIVQEASQGSYVEGGEQAWPVRNSQGVGVEYKKVATVVNCVAVVDPNTKNRARAECQFELTGPVPSESGPKELALADNVTFQLQTAFEADYGKPVVLVDEPEKRLAVTIEESK